MLYPHEPNTIILYFYIYDFNILNLKLFESKDIAIGLPEKVSDYLA